jgi:hypothetical protein
MESIERSARPSPSDPVEASSHRLIHEDSRACWCDPMVEHDEHGNEALIHIAVTWH